MTDLTSQDLGRVVRVATDKTRRELALPTTQPATVIEFHDSGDANVPRAMVHFDDAPADHTAMVKVHGNDVSPGDRVTVDFVPPHGMSTGVANGVQSTPAVPTMAWCGRSGFILDTSEAAISTPIDVSDHIGDRLFCTATIGISSLAPPNTMGCIGYFVLDGIVLNDHPALRENGIAMALGPAGGSDTTRSCSCLLKPGDSVAFQIVNQFDQMSYGVSLDVLDVTGSSFCCEQQHE